MGVEGAIADVAEEEPVLVVGEPTILAPLALLALPAGTNHRRDAHVGAGIVVVLAARRTEEQVLELLDGQFADLAVLPVAFVVQICCVRVN